MQPILDSMLENSTFTKTTTREIITDESKY
jgi:hypothetical protein